MLARDKRSGREVARYSSTTVIWRQKLHGVLHQWWKGKPPVRNPVKITLLAKFARPKGHYGTGRNAEKLKASAPKWHTTYPDADKVARAVGDALVDAGVLADDSIIAVWRIGKVWADADETPGALIVVDLL